jgi:hypothetical protein
MNVNYLHISCSHKQHQVNSLILLNIYPSIASESLFIVAKVFSISLFLNTSLVAKHSSFKIILNSFRCIYRINA